MEAVAQVGVYQAKELMREIDWYVEGLELEIMNLKGFVQEEDYIEIEKSVWVMKDTLELLESKLSEIEPEEVKWSDSWLDMCASWRSYMDLYRDVSYEKYMDYCRETSGFWWGGNPESRSLP